MSELSTVYANSLFEVVAAKEHKQVLEQLVNLNYVFENNPSLALMLSNPMLDDSKKDKLVGSLTKGNQKNLVNLIKLLVSQKQAEIFPEIVADYQERYDQAYLQITAQAISAIPLSKSQIDKLSKNLAKKLNVKNVSIINIINQSIIGGLIIKTNQYIIDGSVVHQLQQIKNKLKAKEEA